MGQDAKLMSSEQLCGFLLSAQEETACAKRQDVNLEVFITNSFPIKIRVSTFDCTDKVLAKALNHFNLPLSYIQYFALYLIKVDNSGDMIVLRKLLHFEAPYMTQQVMRGATRIIIRKE